MPSLRSSRFVLAEQALSDCFKIEYNGVKAAMDAIEGRPVEKRIDTGVTIITKENLNTPEVQALINPK